MFHDAELEPNEIGARECRRLGRLHRLSGLLCVAPLLDPVQCARLLGAGTQFRPETTPVQAKSHQTQLAPSTLPPIEVQPEARRAQWASATRRAELTELVWHDSAESASVAERPAAVADWTCRCCLMSIDEMQAHRRARIGRAPPADRDKDADRQELTNESARSARAILPRTLDQLQESRCRLTRKRLARLVNLGRKLGLRSPRLGNELIGAEFERHQSQCLYELESLLEQTNEWLACQLDRIALADLGRLVRLESVTALHDRGDVRAGPVGQEKDTAARADILRWQPIGARRPNDRPEPRWSWCARERCRSSGAAASSSSSVSSSDRRGSDLVSVSSDSGISLLVQTGEPDDWQQLGRAKRQRRCWPLLESHLELRSSKQFRDLIAFSWQFFQELISNNPLLECRFHGEPSSSNSNIKASSGQRPPLTLNQLKVFARVESQKLRAQLRFHWLARCLWLAFDDRQTTGGELRTRTASSQLPPVQRRDDDGSSDETAHYLDALARLLGRLLRRHLLEEALDRWLQSVRSLLAIDEAQTTTDRIRSGRTAKLRLQVRLVDDDDGQVASSRPESSLKEALAFVVDEISSICDQLPRLECQHLEAPAHIVVLERGDELLAERKRQISVLIDSVSCQHPAAAGDQERPHASSWISAGYVRTISVVNMFRVAVNELDAVRVDAISSGPAAEFRLESGARPAATRALVGFELLDASVWLSGEDRVLELVRQLELTCKQVKLLDELEFELACRLETSSAFGQLAELELDELRAQLAKIIDKERLLLVRFKSDELFKLMEALRKQFDELELNIDLEAAIEDYLNDRWRVRQSQQPGPEQQILLDDEDTDAAAGQHEAALQVEQQQTEIEHRALLDDDAIVGERRRPAAAAPFDDEPAQQQHQQIDDDQETDAAAANSTTAAYREEDEFLQALVNRHNPRVAHLFAMSDPTGGANLFEQELAQGSVAPLIESRLLAQRFKYLNGFVEHELGTFVANLGFVLVHGLAFLCEFGWLQNWRGQQQQRHIRAAALDERPDDEQPPGRRHGDRLALEPEQLELLVELSVRSREFSLLVRDALQRLERAHARLVGSMQSRSHTLIRAVLEFDWLMRKLAERRLESSADENSNIKQLDFIQDTASWSQKLSLRLDFLDCQNKLIAAEGRLLLADCQQELDFLQLVRYECLSAESMLIKTNAQQLIETNEHEFSARSEALERWRPIGRLLNEFWLLAEQFETQQVKWLNSDKKKLDSRQVEHIFELRFQSELDKLRERTSAELRSCTPGQSEDTGEFDVLVDNIGELQARLGEFRRKCLPIMRFLTNKHLTERHWHELHQLLLESGSGDGDTTTLAGAQYTTVAQVLELGIDGRLAGQLDRLGHRATVEHELSELIAAEVRRQEGRHTSRSAASQLESLRALSRLDAWNEHELATAAARFIRLRVGPGIGPERVTELRIDRLARQLVDCHVSVRRAVRLGGHLNLESIGRRGPVDNGQRQRSRPSGQLSSGGGPPCTLVVRSRLSGGGQHVGAALLVESLRLFTEHWLASDARLGDKLRKVSEQLARQRSHLADINELLDQIDVLRASDSRAAIEENELELAELQRASLRLELDREILATREAASLELQAEALRRRDACVKQISERAIPAIRAASRALECLNDGRLLQALRSYRPSPPLAIRLVVEAVCLLRNVCCQSSVNESAGRAAKQPPRGLDAPTATTTTVAALTAADQAEDRFEMFAPLAASSARLPPADNRRPPRKQRTGAGGQRRWPVAAERRCDPMSGQIVEDYWPIAWRTLNGLHSCRLIDDLRRLNQGARLPSQTMALIRRKYLRRPEFQLAKIERYSKEAGQLARWLLAVDVFERVISVVRPNYEEYLRAEADLAGALSSVGQKRSQIETIGRELERMQDSIGRQVGRRVRLVELLDDCVQGSQRLAGTRSELAQEERKLKLKLERLQAKMASLPQASLWTSVRLIYLDALPRADAPLIEHVLETACRLDADSTNGSSC
jgi:hypothetical protein